MATRRTPARKATPAKKTTTPAVTAHEVQAAVEGVVLSEDDSVELRGRRFRIAESIGMMPLLKFAHHSSRGLDTESMEGMAAVYAMLRDVIDTHRPYVSLVGGKPRGEPTLRDPTAAEVTELVAKGKLAEAGGSEWDRFERWAIDTKAEDEELLAVVSQAIELISARPSRRPGNSSAGPPTTSPSSKAISSSPAGPHGPTPEELAALTPVETLRRR